MIVHKTMSLSERQGLGYAGYLDRALCNQRVFAGWHGKVPFLSGQWKNVTCKRCIQLRDQQVVHKFREEQGGWLATECRSASKWFTKPASVRVWSRVTCVNCLKHKEKPVIKSVVARDTYEITPNFFVRRLPLHKKPWRLEIKLNGSWLYDRPFASITAAKNYFRRHKKAFEAA